jgi:hypothetical protein
MPSDSIKIRVRTGNNEAEIEADIGHIHEAIDLLPELIAKLQSGSPLHHQIQAVETAALVPENQASLSSPAIRIEKGDSLSEIIGKFFADPWGRNPRRLSDVRTALGSYGLNYPKQSVAVSLLRLAKSSTIRRFKGPDGEFVYTASTSQMAPTEEMPKLDSLS